MCKFVFLHTFIMKYSVKFFLEKRKQENDVFPIRLRVTYNKNRMEYYTGKRCKSSQWDIKSGRLKRNQIAPDGTTSTEFNNDLDEIKVAVDGLFKLYNAHNSVPAPSALRYELKKKLGKQIKTEPEHKGFFDRFDQYIEDTPVSKGRKKHIRTTYNKVRAFNPDTTFDTVSNQYLTDFKNYLIKSHNLANNTVVSELRRLRAFFSWAVKKGWTDTNPFKNFQIGAESFGDPVFITIKERDKLYNAEIDNESLARVRDIFVFQCMVGCRVSDLKKLTKSNIVDGCIEYIAAKTKDKRPRVARIPLTEKANTILAKYDLPDGKLLPFISEQKYNDYLKDLFRHKNVAINRIVTIVDPKTRRNKQVKISDIVSSHMARRVFIGNLHKKGVKNEIIASMSGHVQHSRAFSRYYNIDKEDQKSAIKMIE